VLRLRSYTAEYRLKIGDFALTGVVDQKFHVEGVAPTNHSSSQKTRLNDLCYDIKSGPIFLPFCHKSLVWLTDRRTDRRTDGWTEFSSLDRVCISCSAVKTERFSVFDLSWVVSMSRVELSAGRALNSTQPNCQLSWVESGALNRPYVCQNY